MKNITIHTNDITLDKLLKWAGITETGGQVKLLLDDKLIYLNDRLVTEKRKKIHLGDIIEIKGIGVWKIISEE